MLKIWESLEIRILLRVAMFYFDRPHDTKGRRFWRKCEDGVRKTGRISIRRIINEYKLVEYLQITNRDYPVLTMR